MNFKSLTVTPLLYVIAGLLIIMAGMGVKMKLDAGAHSVQMGLQRTALAKMTANRDQFRNLADQRKQRIADLTGANQSTKLANDKLAGMLAEQAGKAQETKRLLDAARAARDANARARDLALDKLRSQRENTYATDPDCAAWGARPVCGAISDSLLDQWNKARQLPASGGSSGGGEGQAAGPDRSDPDRGTAPAASAEPGGEAWGTGLHADPWVLFGQAAGGTTHASPSVGR